MIPVYLVDIVIYFLTAVIAVVDRRVREVASASETRQSAVYAPIFVKNHKLTPIKIISKKIHT